MFILPDGKAVSYTHLPDAGTGLRKHGEQPPHVGQEVPHQKLSIIHIYLGKVYSVLFDFDNSIKYYKEGIQMAETLHNNGILINGMNELAGVYTETKD